MSGNLVDNNSSLIAIIDIDRVPGLEEERKGRMKPIPVLFLLLALSLGACGDKDKDPLSSRGPAYDQYVLAIRTGYFNSHPPPNVNIGTVTDRYFGNSEWESIIALDGNRYVNMTGAFSYLGSPAIAKIQFRYYSDGTFILRAFTINGEPQTDFLIGVLVTDMYDEAG